MSEGLKPHLVPLGDGWASWRDIAVRGAGFPAEQVLALTDPQLVAAADAALADDELREAFREEHRAAEGRLTAAIRQFAGDPRFREAVTWQNPKLVKLCLDKVVAGEPRTARGRIHEQAVANYVQRYCTKNDTIGFVGPVGWGRWTDNSAALTLEVGERLLARRTVYFECWAIDAVAQTLSAEAAIRPWLVPRLFSAHRLAGGTLHRPGRPPLELAGWERELLSLVDGVRCVRDIAQALTRSAFPQFADQRNLLPALDALVARGLLQLDLVGGIEAWPERSLLARLEQIPDRTVREQATGRLHGLMAARDRVSAAAGDDVALEQALAELGDCFSAVTGLAGERRPGETYAGRTVVYEDTVRDARIGLGPAVREELAGPLCLLLDSIRWLVAELGQEYHHYLLGLYRRRVEQSGDPVVPLAAILGLATPQLFYDPRGLASVAGRAVAEFQRRWADVLRVPPEARERLRFRSADLAERVAQAFPVRPVPWATAVQHSPDLMLAAADLAAIERGDYLFVLGELHVSFNTMESRVFVQQHDDQAVLLACAEADLGDRRIYGLAPKAAHNVTSRTAPPSALLSPGYTYWTIHPESAVPPAPIRPAADLFVHLAEGDRLIVRSGSGDWQAPLLQVLGEQLSGVAVNSFKPIARDGQHNPRIVIDRLVISRESWSFPADQLAWAAVKNEADRFLAARRWRAEHGLPERAFYRVPVEDKPTYVDFGSLVYVNIFAKAIRRTVIEQGSVGLTEMLPDQNELWLQDRDGGRYTAELRVVTVDQRVPPG
ncbi:MAG TPA: lantibiotic dehydratase [Jatrophihabitans sp.]|nr:lantibiotic dehydratase [Jatrophihabitans sp.]